MYHHPIRIVTLLCMTVILSMPSASHAAARVKDIVDIEGVRENILIGYGLVVGLNGTGDNLKNAIFTQKGLTEFLGKMGISTGGSDLKTKNVAAVTVTATLPPFARYGSRIDVTVSTLGDAKSLQGGMLLATPLLGADGQVYAVSQGPISIGGFHLTGNSGTTVDKGVSTRGFISNGATIEQEIDFEFSSMKTLNLALHNPDISSSLRIAENINRSLGAAIAHARDPGTVQLTIPEALRSNIVALLARIEQIPIESDQKAKIIIEESSGTIVIGENVRLDTVAIAQGNLVVSIKENPAAQQPGAFAPDGAETFLQPNTEVDINEGKDNKLTILKSNATLGQLVNGLNALGVGPRDMISILQNIKAAGALQADIVVR